MKPLKGIEFKRCGNCKRPIYSHNKSGYCSGCQTRIRVAENNIKKKNAKNKN